MEIATSLTGKGYQAGTHRLVSPESTLRRVQPLMSAMGITRIANITGLDSIGIPVVMVCRPNSRSLAVTQGKGLDLPAAKASGLMESVEGFHAEHMTCPLLHGSYEELRRNRALVDVARLPRRKSSLFHTDRPLLWIEGHDLIQDEAIWVPYELIHLNYTLDPLLDTLNFGASSNGLASGNHLLEAISHGICEVVENDARSLWTVRGEEERRRAQLDLSTVDDPACRHVLDLYDRAGVAVSVWDITTDVSLPTFECSIRDRSPSRFHPLYAASGGGCHPARHIALLRALTEAAQSRLTYIAGSRDDIPPENYQVFAAPDTLIAHARKTTSESPGRAFSDIPSWERESFEEDILVELECVRRGGGFDRVIVVNLTQEEFGIPVVRVLIPGMECSEAVRDYRFGVRARSLAGRQ